MCEMLNSINQSASHTEATGARTCNKVLYPVRGGVYSSCGMLLYGSVRRGGGAVGAGGSPISASRAKPFDATKKLLLSLPAAPHTSTPPIK